MSPAHHNAHHNVCGQRATSVWCIWLVQAAHHPSNEGPPPWCVELPGPMPGTWWKERLQVHAGYLVEGKVAGSYPAGSAQCLTLTLRGRGLVHMLWQVHVRAAASPVHTTLCSLEQPPHKLPSGGWTQALSAAAMQHHPLVVQHNLQPRLAPPPSRVKCCVPAWPARRLAPSSLPEDHRSTHPSGLCCASHTAMACMPHPCRQGGSSSSHLGTPQLQLLWRHLLQQGRDVCFDGAFLLLPVLHQLVLLLPPLLLLLLPPLLALLPLAEPLALRQRNTLGPPLVVRDLHPDPW